MVVGTLSLSLSLPENLDLKGKRRVVSSIIDRVHRRFNVSIAEVDGLDAWQRATLGVALVSNDRGHARLVLERVRDWVEANGQAVLVDSDLQVF